MNQHLMRPLEPVENAWLIERALSGGTVLAPAQYWGTGPQGWTVDSRLAVRFARQYDASRAIDLLSGHLYLAMGELAIVTEHTWG